ncbi:MAG: hypoxanthine phosphoribosyltransferase [Clostridia bacterium]|nr:hypoxanthine phosphoribosyltransferase [Clostridia bacterium]
MINEIEKVLVSEDEIKVAVKNLANQLNIDYAGEKPIVVCILKGSIFFTADLVRELNIPVTIDFMSVSSYGSGTISSGELKVKKDLSFDITGRHVILIEDIIDSGNTLYKLKNLLLERNPASIKIAALLNKPDRRVTPINADYCCFTIPDEFVVGYGLDYDERYRTLKDVCVLSRSVYEK